jgi:uncharacterized delta-60 repeat protein
MKKTTYLLFSLLITLQITYAQPTQQWLNRYNGQGDLSDKFNAVKTDASSNVYLTGYTYSIGNAENVLTIKMNSLGDTAWARTYNGTANNTDEAYDITTDAAGNVYVTGVAKNLSTGKDFVTIKYNSIGDTLWVRTYNGTGNGDDIANKLFVDASGNVYVTGQSDGDATVAINYDYATVKYSSTGVQLWATRYNGAGNLLDNPIGVAADALGNVFVSGRSSNGLNDDYATIKYNVSGVQQWAMLYDGAGTDRASAISIDNASNVYVTGRSSNGTDDDFTTIKYNTTGLQQWLMAYDGGLGNDRATALTTDASGNVYVTGKTSNGLTDDYLTIKYDITGTQQWLGVWIGAGGGNDAPSAIAVDGSGNVYVTGQSDVDPAVTINNNYSTVKYNSSGTQMWNQLYNGTANLSDGANAIAIDASGNVIVAGNSHGLATQRDGVAIKYDPNGTSLWTYRFDGQGDNSDKANAIIVDGIGNTYVTGSAVRTGASKDYCTIKYNSLGDTTWVKTFNGAGNNNDEASAIAVDASGNVYVTGYAKGLTSSKDITTIKYNSIGDTLWIKSYNGTGNGDDYGVALKVDASGNVFVTGYSDGDATVAINYDYVTIKYNSTGTQLWATRYNGTGNATDQPVGICIDGSGNSYVTGKSSNGADDDFRTIKYNSSGVQQWNMVYDGSNGNDRAAAITIDASANIYVTGRTSNGTDDDFATIKYSSTGAQLWISLYDGIIGNDRALAIAVAAGNVYVTGQSSVGLTDDFATVKYNATGIQQWVKTYNGSANGNDVPSSINVDGAGNIIVAGTSNNGTNDYEIVKYGNAGNQMWAQSYNGASLGIDGINSMAIDNVNNIYVTGVSYSTAGQKDIVTIKYNSPVTTAINEYKGTSEMMSVYPNPFTIQTTIAIRSLNNIPTWTLDVYDATGKKIISQIIENSNSTIIKKNNLSSGIYFYKATNKTQIIGSGNFIILE